MLKEKIQNILELIQEANDIYDSEADWKTKLGLIYSLNIETFLQEIGLSCYKPIRRVLDCEMDIKNHILSLREIEKNLKKVVEFKRHVHDPSLGHN